MKKSFRVFLAVLLIVIFFSPLSKVRGSDCKDASKIFSSSYNLVFSFDEKGDAHVTQKVGLKNLVEDCVAKEYALKINSTKIQFLSGADSQGALIVKTKKDKNSTLISARLNDFVIGKNKTVVFQLHYKIRELAKKQGLIWTLTVPQIAASEKIETYSLKLLVPSNFGEVFMISPKPRTISTGKKQTTVTFSKNKILNRTVSASFGKDQEITFQLKAQLENTGFLSKKIVLPLPADGQKQQILFTSINPKPAKITLDGMGNYLAEYHLPADKSIEVSIKGVTKIPGENKNFSPPVKITSSKLEKMISPSRYLQTQDRLIQKKAKELETADAIYDFVTNYLEYDTDGFKARNSARKGALDSLNKKTPATSLDFVDLFVALAKAAGLPSREVFGFALSDGKGFKPSFVGEPLNTTNLHVWAQIYDNDKNTWVNYDPTWANTSGIDYIRGEFSDRFILFISPNGEDIDILKNFSLSADNVKIVGAKKSADFTPKVNLELSTDQAFAGFPTDLKIKLENKSGVTLSNGKIITTVENIVLLGDKEIEIEPLLPYETKTHKVRLRAGDIFKTTQGKAAVSLEALSGRDKIVLSKEKSILVASFFSLGVQQILLIILITLLIIGVVVPKLQTGRKR